MLGKIVKWGLVAVVTLVVVAGIVYAWAISATQTVFAKTHETHVVELPVPFPLSEAELTELRAQKLAEAEAALAAAGGTSDGVTPASTVEAVAADPLAGIDLNALALERAIARGKHLVDARYGCFACHGSDMGGGEMINDPMVGTLMGANLTKGKGSVVLDFKPSDWERQVRHGVRPDGKGSVMPSGDYKAMSDHELSDIIAYITSLPPVDRESIPVTYGPILNMQYATGGMVTDAEKLSGVTEHLAEPPPTGPTAEFGGHLIHTCTGCHREGLEGGPMPFGPPSWPPARNLTPDASGVAGWTFEDFDKALRQGVRPDGTALQLPMSLILPMAAAMTDVERQALWAHLQSLPPTPTGI